VNVLSVLSINKHVVAFVAAEYLWAVLMFSPK